MKIIINIQSYKRADRIDTLELFNRRYTRLWVHEFEKKEYTKNYGKIVRVLPDSLRGNLPKVKNYILDHQTDADVNVMVDDDIKMVAMFEGDRLVKIENDDLYKMIEKYSIICRGFGFYLWGINVNIDKQCYREYSPFSTKSYVSSSFSCFLKGNHLRYDPRFPLKEDYDMTIQQCNEFRGLLRINKMCYEKKSAENIGGCALYRNMDNEMDQLKLLQQKWGTAIVKIDNNIRSHNIKKKKNLIDFNPIIRVPIRGI